MRKTLYLIPGTMCNEKLWSELSNYLVDDFDLVHLPIPNDKSFDEITEYYSETLKGDELNLIGFSLGGYSAGHFTHQYPDRVSNLIVISNGLTELPSAEVKQRNHVLQYVKAKGYSGISRTKVAALLDESKRTDSLIEQIQEMDRESGIDTFLSQYHHTTHRKDLYQELACAPCNTFIFCSEKDILVDLSWYNEATFLASNISVTRISGSGHMLPLENPEQLAKYIQHCLA
ncbi:alpha/beta fold hydrolase [Vibrio penaeicida]|uniref:Alpha/beta hydrolase n=1 Tax=Vibrio penaeicida TaxID=104609 RepID=A0AAV5P0I7_9VIBR|nr:alpha/beta hydrolase [Vibrio penaeicida]GLQ76084.1 alpha/beta hydrolase [Vibrio penaeicida]